MPGCLRISFQGLINRLLLFGTFRQFIPSQFEDELQISRRTVEEFIGIDIVSEMWQVQNNID